MNLTDTDDRQARLEDQERRWWAALPALPDRSSLFIDPPAPTRCKRCGAPTPDMATRMHHDEMHAASFEWRDSC